MRALLSDSQLQNPRGSAPPKHAGSSLFAPALFLHQLVNVGTVRGLALGTFAHAYSTCAANVEFIQKRSNLSCDTLSFITLFNQKAAYSPQINVLFLYNKATSQWF